MHRARPHALLACATLTVALLQACGFAPPPSPVEPLKILVSRMDASAHCRGEAYRIDVGLDLSGNRLLDGREVTHAVTVCGAAGPGDAPATLVRISGDAGADRCPAGGYRLVAGADTDGDGLLSREEVESVADLCHAVGPAGGSGASRGRALAATPLVRAAAAGDGAGGALQALVRIESAAPSSACRGRSSRTSSGLDLNRNRVLDPVEVDVTQIGCAAPLEPSRGVAILSLPGDAGIGQTLQVTGAGGDAWQIAQAPGQRINTERLQGPWGGNWSPTGPRVRWSAIAQSADGRRILAAGDGTLLHSTDSGASWHPTGLSIRDVRWSGVASSSDGQILAASSRGHGIHVSEDGGEHWTRRTDDGGWGLLAASSDMQRLLAEREHRQLWLSQDGGRTWQRCAPQAEWTGLASSADGRVLAAVARGGRLHVSSDGGLSWRAKGEPADFSAVAMTADGRRLYVARRDGVENLHHSDDHGDTWTASAPAGLSHQPLAGLAISARGHAIVAATANGALWSSSDGGLRWQVDQSPQPLAAVAVTSEGLARFALTDGGRIYRAAAATTPGPAGALSFGADRPVSLRHLGMGVWAVLSYAGPFYVQ